jgi:hypothetical protein
MVNIVLTETPTYQILHIPSVVVSTDDEELKDRVAAERKRYENVRRQLPSF